MRRLAYIFLAVMLAVAPSCKNARSGQAPKAETIQTTSGPVEVRYAQGFILSYTDGGVLVDIQDPQRERSESFHFFLKQKDAAGVKVPEGYTGLEVPVSSVVCMTSLQLSNFICLDALDCVVGITSTRHLFNEEMKGRLKSGKTAKIGIEGNFDNEVIMNVNPDVIFISPFKRGGYDAMRETGIPLVPHLGYKEMTPLGQAE